MKHYDVVSKILKQAYILPDKILERVRPTKPHNFLTKEIESFEQYLPYVSYLNLDRPTCLLNDGSLGVMWELSLIPHETCDHDTLVQKLETLTQVFDTDNQNISFQIIFDSEPALCVKDADKLALVGTTPERILSNRIEYVRNIADHKNSPIKLMSRKIFLTVRYARQNDIALKSFLERNQTELEFESLEFACISQEFSQVCRTVEYNLTHAGIAFKTLDQNEFVFHLRDVFHATESRKFNTTLQSDYREDKVLSGQILKEFIEITPSAIGVGQDTWEVLSWIDQPSVVYTGLAAKFLSLQTPFKIVLNIRKCLDVSDLERKRFFLKNAVDSFGELQREEIKQTQDRVARDESLLFVSMHILVRNCGLSALTTAQNGVARQLVSQLKTLTQIDFIYEKYAAPAIFLMSLPFGYSHSCSGISGREQRVLSRNIAPYLPLLGGFQGTKTPLQLMIGRAGDSVWLNPFDTQTSPHVAILAGSGAGKSFFTQNMMMSFLAVYQSQKPLIFIIDKKTSYEIFARVIGEESGSQIVKPPEYFPNIFKGSLDEYRLPVIVGILKTAISLVSQNARIEAVEEMLLSQAVKTTFEQQYLDASTEFKNGSLQDKAQGKVQIPRLSDIVDNLFPVCAKLQISKSVAENLTQYLSPFLENGAYRNLFNKIEYDELDPKTPTVSLFDIDAVTAHPVLSTLTTQMILSEILRQIRRPENIGRPGMLVIEEVGVLAQGSKELVQFITDAWKTFRKLGFACVGLTNEVDDYVKDGAREIWNVSANKIILKMTSKDLQKALHGEAGYPALIKDTLFGNIIGSLKKEDGRYSQGFWWSDEVQGSFTYIPTGFDYWCSASKPIEVQTVYDVSALFAQNNHYKPFFEAIKFLANRVPNGIRDAHGALRRLTKDELNLIIEQPNARGETL